MSAFRRFFLALLPLTAMVLLSLAGCGAQMSGQMNTGQTAAAAILPESETAEKATAAVFAMDTIITLEAYGGMADQAVLEAESQIKQLENLWSVTDENSEIYRANHSQGQPVKISPSTEYLIDYALKMAEETEGRLNPAIYPVLCAWGFTTKQYRVPEADELEELLKHTDYRQIQIKNGFLTIPAGMEIDLGAVAKGYAGDLLRETLTEKGIRSTIVNLGGNVNLIGSSKDGKHWKVGIRSPYGDGNIGVLEGRFELNAASRGIPVYTIDR